MSTSVIRAPLPEALRQEFPVGDRSASRETRFSRCGRRPLHEGAESARLFSIPKVSATLQSIRRGMLALAMRGIKQQNTEWNRLRLAGTNYAARPQKVQHGTGDRSQGEGTDVSGGCLRYKPAAE